MWLGFALAKNKIFENKNVLPPLDTIPPRGNIFPIGTPPSYLFLQYFFCAFGSTAGVKSAGFRNRTKAASFLRHFVRGLLLYWGCMNCSSSAVDLGGIRVVWRCVVVYRWNAEQVLPVCVCARAVVFFFGVTPRDHAPEKTQYYWLFPRRRDFPRRNI